MLPELGRYAFAVLAAYGVTFALLGGLVALSLARAWRIRRALAEAEHHRPRPPRAEDNRPRPPRAEHDRPPAPRAATPAGGPE
ncbi:hypothetical protein BH23PSE1_BH23PSE1_07540 [soil metagenome]